MILKCRQTLLHFSSYNKSLWVGAMSVEDSIFGRIGKNSLLSMRSIKFSTNGKCKIQLCSMETLLLGLGIHNHMKGMCDKLHIKTIPFTILSGR